MKTTLLQLNKAHYPVTVLGPGRRIGIWFQGCSIGCRGCVSQDTWDKHGGGRLSIPELMAWCKKQAQQGIDGITLSGGEPFDQPQALAALLGALARWRRHAGLNFDILCYSGYPFHTLQTRHQSLLARLDALISEPYVDGLPLGDNWCGSSNQKLHLLSDRARQCYAGWVTKPVQEKRMQMSIEAGRIWMIGIPDRGDMARLEALCAERGLGMGQVSWRR